MPDLRGIQDRKIRDAIRHAIDQGWSFEYTKRHWRVMHPTDPSVMIVGACTPSDHRGTKNMISRLRRAGVHIPH